MSAGAIAAGTVGAGIASGRASYLADQANGKNLMLPVPLKMLVLDF